MIRVKYETTQRPTNFTSLKLLQNRLPPRPTTHFACVRPRGLSFYPAFVGRVKSQLKQSPVSVARLGDF